MVYVIVIPSGRPSLRAAEHGSFSEYSLIEEILIVNFESVSRGRSKGRSVKRGLVSTNENSSDSRLFHGAIDFRQGFPFALALKKLIRTSVWNRRSLNGEILDRH